MKFWWSRKKVALQELPEPVRELTGIEKVELEQQQAKVAEGWRAHNEHIASLKLQIAEIEQQIGPQMQRLQQLKDQLDPWTAQYRMMASAGQQSLGMQGYYGHGFFRAAGLM